MNTTQQKKEPPAINLPFVAPGAEQFMVMANSAPVLLWMDDIDQNCFFVNKPWLQFTGRTIEQESGSGWTDGVHPEDIDRCVKTYTEAFDKKEEFKMEYRLRRYDGQYRWILDNGIPYFTKDRIFQGYIGSCVDIHDLKVVEQRRERFIIAASHELKTPVTTLNLYLHLISEYFNNKGDEKYGSYADCAVEQVKKITGLINQLLDITRLQSDLFHFDWSVFPFYDFILDTVKKIQHITHSHKIVITGHCKGNVKADKERLSQVMENLLSNAIKYSCGQDKIIVHLSEDTKYVKASVIDFGIGIDKDHLPKIFDRFYRIPGKKEETFPGLGIGLFITHQIIKLLGGKIWVESIKNKETKFNFEIPVY